MAGRTAVVTGGAQGLGLAIAQRFVAEGARVVLGDLNVEATDAAAASLGGADVDMGLGVKTPCGSSVAVLVGSAGDGLGLAAGASVGGR